MSYYWAKFEKIGNNIFRYDTRIYLKTINSPGDNDICIGAIVGKNPGSAVAYSPSKNGLQKINLDGDKLLPNMRSIFLKAYQNSNIPIDDNAYIQVLNLMYICDKNLGQAIKKIVEHKTVVNCSGERRSFPFTWYVWGNNDKRLNKYKVRFDNIDSEIHFFLDTKTNELVNKKPTVNDSARHTQGMRHELVIPYISDILKSMTLRISS